MSGYGFGYEGLGWQISLTHKLPRPCHTKKWKHGVSTSPASSQAATSQLCDLGQVTLPLSLQFPDL